MASKDKNSQDSRSNRNTPDERPSKPLYDRYGGISSSPDPEPPNRPPFRRR